VVRGADNGGPENPEVVALLRQAEAGVRERADLTEVAGWYAGDPVWAVLTPEEVQR